MIPSQRSIFKTDISSLKRYAEKNKSIKWSDKSIAFCWTSLKSSPGLFRNFSKPGVS